MFNSAFYTDAGILDIHLSVLHCVHNGFTAGSRWWCTDATDAPRSQPRRLNNGAFIVKCEGRSVTGSVLLYFLGSSLLQPKVSMAAATTPAVPEQTPKTSPPGPVSFDFSQPPIIEGFNPLPRVKDEGFKEKLLRKTKENPFVPIGELYKRGNTEERSYTSAAQPVFCCTLWSSLLFYCMLCHSQLTVRWKEILSTSEEK